MDDKNPESYIPELKHRYFNLISKFPASDSAFNDRIKIASEIVNSLKDSHLYFHRRNLDSNISASGNYLRSSIFNLASNDYLDFSKRPEIINSC